MKRSKLTGGVEKGAKKPKSHGDTSSAKDSADFFHAHFCEELAEDYAKKLQSDLPAKKTPISLPSLPNTTGVHLSRETEQHCTDPTIRKELDQFGVPPAILKNFNGINCASGPSASQEDLYQTIGRYMDLCCVTKSSEYLPLLCMHTLNHVTRTRQIVIANKKRLDALSEKGELTDDDIERARDQGLARPKVLILSAYKKHAYEIVQGLIKLVFGEGDRTHVLNSQRFESEFGDDGSRLHEKRNAPDDYRDLMAGNTDDCFRIGIGLAKKSLKLYTKFSEADILLCSPLGLRMVIGDETEEKREHDFLASIEVLIIDKAHILLMQNWEHLTNILQTVNSIPAQVDVDISRVRHWSLKHLAKYYRQTIAFSDVNFSELHALFSHYCHNYAGQVTLTEIPDSILHQIEVPIVQELHRFDVPEPQNQSDYRFNYFVKEILPKCEHGTAVFVSSYFDYVRLRNYLKKESESFVQLHEYAKDAKIAKGRGLFYNGHKKLMLITERFHFFRRYHVRGIKSLVFYQVPVNAHFYTELINMTVPEGKLHSRLLFCKFDLLRLQNVFGAKEGKQLVTSPKKFHALLGE